MINLDQVRTLEWKVKQAVQLIVQLRRENDMLRGRLSDTEVRLQELESMVEAFKVTQSQMESGIRSALDELDHLDTSEMDAPAEPAVAAPAEPEAAPVAEESVSEVALEHESALVPDTIEATDEAFEEEYAALVAAEAASLVDPPEEAAPEPAEEKVEAEKDREPEQPGLGIF
jgi:hypothetical protein